MNACLKDCKMLCSQGMSPNVVATNQRYHRTTELIKKNIKETSRRRVNQRAVDIGHFCLVFHGAGNSDLFPMNG